MTAVTVPTPRASTTIDGNADPLAPQRDGKRVDPLGAEVMKRWRDSSDELMKQRRDYWQNLAFFFGEQWVWFSEKRNTLQAIPQNISPLGRGRARQVRNRIRPNLESLLGRMLRNDLEFDVPPTDSADDVVSGAMLAEDVLSAAHRDLDWRKVRFQENFAKFMGGTAAVCVEWDATAGTPLTVDSSSNKVVGTGEADLCALSINEFGIQPGVRDARKARWWIQALAYSPEVVKEMFALDWTPGADASSLQSPLQQRLLEHMGKSQGANRLTLVLKMYEKPNPKCVKGRYTIVVNGITVADKPWPFPTKELNLFVFHQQQIDSSWIGTTLVNDAVPIQTAYNFMRSCIMEHAKKVGNARLMASLGSFEEEDLSDDPGSVLFYSPDLGGGIPQYLRPPDLPRWMVSEASDLKAELDDVMFVHATSRGEASFDRASGQALALLAEKDDSPLGLMAFEESQQWAMIGEYVLKLYEKKVSETRTVQVHPNVGQPGEVRMARWNGQMLKGQTRVVVPLETTLPVSQAAMQAFARDLYDRGLLKDPVAFARMLRLPQRELMQVLDADAARAQRENVRMMHGEAPSPETFDNHATHIAEHNRFRKALAADEPVLTPTGWRPIGDLAFGDLVVTGDGTWAAVTHVEDFGEQDAYRLVFNDGSTVRADAHHIWTCRGPNERWHYRRQRGRQAGYDNPRHGEWIELRTEEIIDRWGQTPAAHHRIEIPLVGIPHFATRPVSLDPYTLGAILGDGAVGPRGSVRFASADPELVKNLACATTKHASDYGYGLVGIAPIMREMGLAGHRSWEKFVPEMYLWNSAEIRIATLRGLMDTDGWCSKTGHAGYCTTSPQLRDDVVFLVRSLGGTCSVYSKQTKRPSWELAIRMPWNPFALERKAERFVPATPKRLVRSIRRDGTAPMRCITISDPSGLFVTRDFIVTHNSDSYQFAPDAIRHVVDLHIKYHEQLAGEQLGAQTQRAMLNPAVAALPQGDEPPGSIVPPDYAEQQAGQAMVGASATAMQAPGAPGGQPPPGPAGQPPPTSPAMAAGQPQPPGGPQ